jgi:hypothetical protein
VTATDIGAQGVPGAPDQDEIATAFERRRAGQAHHGVNTSSSWQVRIGWYSEPPTVWPPFTYDTRDTKERAEYCALQAMSWQGSDESLYVISASVRGPGESEWMPVAASHVVPA